MAAPLNRLERYIIRSLLIGFMLVAVVLLAVMGLFDLAEQLEEVGNGDYRFDHALWHTALRLPRRLVELMPFIALLGGLVGLGLLTIHNELTAMMAAGMRPLSLVRAILLALTSIALVQAIGSGWLAPMAEQAALTQQRQLTEASSVTESAFWARDRTQVLRIGGLRHGRIPVDIELFELDGDQRLERYVHAREADIRGPERWLLEDAVVKRPGADNGAHNEIDVLAWRPFLDAERMRTLQMPAQTLGINQLRAYVAELQQAGRDAETYQLMLWRKPGAVVLTLVMGLLALPFATRGSPRSSLAPRLVAGALTGIVVFIAEELLVRLGSRLDLPVGVVALAPAGALTTALLIMLCATIAARASVNSATPR